MEQERIKAEEKKTVPPPPPPQNTQPPPPKPQESPKKVEQQPVQDSRMSRVAQLKNMYENRISENRVSMQAEPKYDIQKFEHKKE